MIYLYNKKKYFIIEKKNNIFKKIKYNIKKIFIYKKIFKNYIKYKKILKYNNKNIIYINKKNYKKLIYNKNNKKGILFLYYKNKFSIKNIKKKKILIILDNIEKPGNIGAIIRILYSMNIKILILSNFKTNIYNNNIIKSSLNYILNIKIYNEKIKNIYNFLKKNNYLLIITNTKKKKSKNIYNINFKKKKKIAIIFGSENKGINIK
ncbi:MAG: TrmH family RNA methyltransferase [Candidatus Shikimatogenerans sp. Ttur]|uniref:TrmH family RNA methyltransferase n=1 Tax=Candidatus Shikimatogenerans sp. Ttur TaxID=3158569 RepID=A0AAU7ZXI8_9FLAO